MEKGVRREGAHCTTELKRCGDGGFLCCLEVCGNLPAYPGTSQPSFPHVLALASCMLLPQTALMRGKGKGAVQWWLQQSGRSAGVGLPVPGLKLVECLVITAS